MVIKMENEIEIKKMDSQGRLVPSKDWFESEIGKSKELYIIKKEDYLKIIPKQRIDLTEKFDKIDLGIEAIENWKEFKKIYGISK